MGTGPYATWINSDDMLCKDALGNQLKSCPSSHDVILVGDCIHIDQDDRILCKRRGSVETLEELIRIDKVWRRDGGIDQPAVLFPRELAISVGGVNESNHRTMDYELWGNLLHAGARLHYTGVPGGMFRHHLDQKTADMLKQTESLVLSAKGLLEQSSLPDALKKEIRQDLDRYWAGYPKQLWMQSGRLAKFGLPSAVVLPLRSGRDALTKTFRRLVS
jgi:hypothetical protein